MNGDRLVLVESNTSGTGRLFVSRAVELGLRPVLLTSDPGRYPWAVAEVRVIDTSDLTEVVRACDGLEGTVAGVLSSSEHYVPIAAAAARLRGLPGNCPSAVHKARDKTEQRRALVAGGVPVPSFVEVTDADGAASAAGRLGAPVVVKPVLGTGSIGVRLCAGPRHAAAHARSLLAQTTNDRGLPVPRRVLVEEFVAGPEYSVEIFDGHVVGVTRKHLGPAPFFVETGHDFPAPLPSTARDRLTGVALAATRVLGLTAGPAHVELRQGVAGPTVIEVNPRLAGGWIPRLVREATGVDLVTETVRAATGATAALSPRHSGAASIRFLVAARDGTVAGFTGVEEARRAEGVMEVELYRQPGTLLRRHGDFRDRIGHVVTGADAVRTTALAADHAIRLVKAVIEETRDDQ